MYLCIILKTILCLPHIIYDIVSMIEIKILQNLILNSLFVLNKFDMLKVQNGVFLLVLG